MRIVLVCAAAFGLGAGLLGCGKSGTTAAAPATPVAAAEQLTYKCSHEACPKTKTTAKGEPCPTC